MKNYHTRLLKLILLTLFVHLTTTILGSNLMDVKGRTIVLTTPNDGINYALDCFYDPIALEKGFKTKYIYNRAKGNVTPSEDILQRHFYVEDVIYDTYNDETLGVCVKLIRKDDNAKILFYIPPFKKYVAQTGSAYQRAKESAFSRLKHHSFYMAHCEWKHTNDLFSHQSVFNPISIQLSFIDIDKVETYADMLKNQCVDTYTVDKNKRIRFIELKEIIYDYYGVNFQCIINGDTRHTQRYSLNELEVMNLIDKQVFIESCRNRYVLSYISDLKTVYQGQKLRITKSLSAITDKKLRAFYELCRKNSKYGESPICRCESIELEYIEEFNIPEYRYYATLVSENGDMLKLPINSDFTPYFTFNDVYVEEQRLKTERDAKKAAEREVKRQQDEQEQKRKEAEYRAELVRKYGKYNAGLILDGQVRIGFTKEMCILSWGKPYDINRNINQYGTYEQWVYNLSCYLYFDDDKLTTIQN